MMYLENFQLNLEDRRVYPYRTIYPMQLESIELAPITIFYGSNGCGKSTLLNIIAEKIGLSSKTLGNTNEYFTGYARKCTFTEGRKGIPQDSMLIRSEDIMAYITDVRKKNAEKDKIVKSWFRNELAPSERDTLAGELQVQQDFEDFYDRLDGQKSFHHIVASKLSSKVEEESNGETAISYYKDRLWADNLYLLDEPENSMSPVYQQELARYIAIMAYRLNTQFVIATHSPFILSMEGARIYDLDSQPSQIRQWFELDNMKEYFKLFRKYESKFNLYI